MNRHFSKEDIHATNKHAKKSSVSLIIREMHVQTPKRYHRISVKMAVIKKSSKDLEPTQMLIKDRLDKENEAYIHHEILCNHKK